MAEENQEEDSTQITENDVSDEVQENPSKPEGEEPKTNSEILQDNQEVLNDQTKENDLEAEMLQAIVDETSAPNSKEEQNVLQRAQSMLSEQELTSHTIENLLDIKLMVSIELGRTEVPISNLLEWAEGSLIELDKESGEPVEVRINDKCLAKGEVVTIAENFGVRVTEIIPLPPKQ